MKCEMKLISSVIIMSIIILVFCFVKCIYYSCDRISNQHIYPDVAVGCERTLALIKPHAVIEKKTGNIINMIESAGFTIIAIKKITLSSDFVYKFYMHHTHYPWFSEYVHRMTAGPVVIMVLEKEHAVADWDTLKEEIRLVYGIDNKDNAVHGSDSVSEAHREIALCFPDMK